jgi:hypothetical protein
MKNTLLFINLFFSILGCAQNEAFFVSQDFHLFKMDLDKGKIIEQYTFLDSIVSKRTEIDFSIISEYTQSEIDSLGHVPIFEYTQDGVILSYGRRPSFYFTNDSVFVNDKWYTIEIIQTDDHFVGGSPNRVTTDVFVEDLGLVYSYANWINAHMDLMICHRNAEKQEILISAYECLAKKHPIVIEKSDLTRIIYMTKELEFNNIVDLVSARWLKPRNDLKLLRTNSTNIDGQLNYVVTIKNVSSTGYWFIGSSEFGPAEVEQRQNDDWIISPIDGDSHGTRYYYNFQIHRENIYLDSGEEITFHLKPNERQNCGICNENKFYGFQVHRYGMSFFQWLFSEPVKHDGKLYEVYQLKEIH